MPPLGKRNPGSAANAYIAKVIKEIKKDWMPTLGYGWQDASSVKKEVSKRLEQTGFSSGLTQYALGQWGIQGSRISGSPFAIIGTWAAMLDYYYDSIFAPLLQANTKSDMDKQVLWSQQDTDLYDSGFSSNSINQIIKQSDSHEDLFKKLRKAYLRDKKGFKGAQWKSLLNMGGPGERFIVANESDTISKPKDLLTLGKTSQSKLQMELTEVDSYSAILNMAWLEDLYTRQGTPILMYNKLNVDELNAVRFAVRHRDQTVNVHFERMLENLGGDSSPVAVFFYLFERLLQQFYQTLYVARRSSSKSTIARLETISNKFDCLQISGLLKTDPGGKSDIALTGTGKEFFYLLAKGATPFICGEFFILSPTADANSLAKKLAAIPVNQKFNLAAYYQPVNEAPSYVKLISGNKGKMPFMSGSAGDIEKSLFSLSELPTFSENVLSW